MNIEYHNQMYHITLNSKELGMLKFFVDMSSNLMANKVNRKNARDFLKLLNKYQKQALKY